MPPTPLTTANPYLETRKIGKIFCLPGFILSTTEGINWTALGTLKKKTFKKNIFKKTDIKILSVKLRNVFGPAETEHFCLQILKPNSCQTAENTGVPQMGL